MCAGATIYSSIKRCALSPGDWLIISGCGGGLGHLGIQFAKALGYKVVGIDARLKLRGAASVLDGAVFGFGVVERLRVHGRSP